MPRASGPPRPGRGFTLIELLVVIAIIAVLVGLLLPAVQKVREAAARARCQNNLHQLGTAVHNYESAQGRLPDAGATTTMLSWHVEVLPQLEQAGLYSQISQATGSYLNAGKNDPHGLTKVSTFQCPVALSDRSTTGASPYQPYTPEVIGGVNPFTTHYYGISGPRQTGSTYGTTASTAFEGVSQSSDGLFLRGMTIRMKDVIDGTTNTLMIGEMSWDVPTVGTRYRTWLRGCSTEPVCASARNVAVAINRHTLSPYMDMPMGSPHPGGTNFAMADASVRFIPQTVDFPTYLGLASRNGGEVLGVY